jgi:hypothetical protein
LSQSSEKLQLNWLYLGHLEGSWIRHWLFRESSTSGKSSITWIHTIGSYWVSWKNTSLLYSRKKRKNSYLNPMSNLRQQVLLDSKIIWWTIIKLILRCHQLTIKYYTNQTRRLKSEDFSTIELDRMSQVHPWTLTNLGPLNLAGRPLKARTQNSIWLK